MPRAETIEQQFSQDIKSLSEAVRLQNEYLVRLENKTNSERKWIAACLLIIGLSFAKTAAGY